MRNVYVEIVGEVPPVVVGPSPVSDVRWIVEAAARLCPDRVVRISDAGNVLPFRTRDDR